MRSLFKKMIALNLALLSVLITPGGVYAGDPLNSQTNSTESPTATVPAGAAAPPSANPLLKPPVAADSFEFINSSPISPVAIKSNAEIASSPRHTDGPMDRARTITATVGLVDLFSYAFGTRYDYQMVGLIGDDGKKYMASNTYFRSGPLDAVGSILQQLKGKKVRAVVTPNDDSASRNIGLDGLNSLSAQFHSITVIPGVETPNSKPIDETKFKVPSVMWEKPVVFCTVSQSDVVYSEGGTVYCGAGDNSFKMSMSQKYRDLVQYPITAVLTPGFASWRQSGFASPEESLNDFQTSSESMTNNYMPGYQGTKKYVKQEVINPEGSYRPVTTEETVIVGPFTPTSAIDTVTDPLSKVAGGYFRNWVWVESATVSTTETAKMTPEAIRDLSTKLAAVYSYSSTYGMGGSTTVWMFTEKAAKIEKVPGTNSTKVEALKAEVAAAQAAVNQAVAADTKAQEQKKLAEKTLADNQLTAANASKAAAAATKAATKAKNDSATAAKAATKAANDSAIAVKASTKAANDSAIATKAATAASNAVAEAERAVSAAKQPAKAAAIKLLNTKKLAAAKASKDAAAAAQAATKAANDAAIAAKTSTKATNDAAIAAKTSTKATNAAAVAAKVAADASKAAVAAEQAAAKATAIVTELKQKALNAAKTAVTSAQAKAAAGKILEAKKTALQLSPPPAPPMLDIADSIPSKGGQYFSGTIDEKGNFLDERHDPRGFLAITNTMDAWDAAPASPSLDRQSQELLKWGFWNEIARQLGLPLDKGRNQGGAVLFSSVASIGPAISKLIETTPEGIQKYELYFVAHMVGQQLTGKAAGSFDPDQNYFTASEITFVKSISSAGTVKDISPASGSNFVFDPSLISSFSSTTNGRELPSIPGVQILDAKDNCPWMSGCPYASQSVLYRVEGAAKHDVRDAAQPLIDEPIRIELPKNEIPVGKVLIVSNQNYSGVAILASGTSQGNPVAGQDKNPCFYDANGISSSCYNPGQGVNGGRPGSNPHNIAEVISFPGLSSEMFQNLSGPFTEKMTFSGRVQRTLERRYVNGWEVKATYDLTSMMGGAATITVSSPTGKKYDFSGRAITALPAV